MRPRKAQTLVEVAGVGQWKIFWTFDKLGSIPQAEIWCLRKLSSVKKKLHFFLLQNNLVLASAFITMSMCLICSAMVLDQITILSRYTRQIFLMRWCRAEFIQRWWMGGTFFGPCSITVHLYRPKGVVIAVRCTLSGCTHVWKKEFIISRRLHIQPFTQSARMSSTRGSRYESSTVLEFRTQ